MKSAKAFKADLSQSSVSRYIQLATLFRRRIESGQWRPGQQIPTIDELAAECQVARATIRQALSTLIDEGMITSYRAKGTFVNNKLPEPLWCEVHTDWNGLLLRPKGNVSIEILKDEGAVPPPHVSSPIGTIQQSYRHLRRRHSRDGKRYLLADVYIDEKLSRKLPKSAISNETAMRLASLIPGIKIVDARQTLTIGTADIETAELLSMPLNSPVCIVDRYAVDQQDRVILIAMGIYRGDMVRMDLKLR